MPLRQASHLPQEEMQEISTWLPGLNCVTPAPTSSTTPTPSCPRIRPGSQLGTSPFRIWRSVPQIVVLEILTIASVGAPIAGFGRSSTAFFPGP